MSKDAKDLAKWLVVAALAIILYALLATPLKSQEVFYANLQEPLLGQTVCNDSNVIILVDYHVKDTPKEYFVIQHEAVHVRLMRRYGCKEALRLYQTDENFKFQAELEAYCAEYKDSLFRSMDKDSERMQFILFMWQKYAPSMEMETVAHKVDSC